MLLRHYDVNTFTKKGTFGIVLMMFHDLIFTIKVVFIVPDVIIHPDMSTSVCKSMTEVI